jgi:hypothetical protein
VLACGGSVVNDTEALIRVIRDHVDAMSHEAGCSCRSSTDKKKYKCDCVRAALDKDVEELASRVQLGGNVEKFYVLRHADTGRYFVDFKDGGIDTDEFYEYGHTWSERDPDRLFWKLQEYEDRLKGFEIIEVTERKLVSYGFAKYSPPESA